jgi:hypothetical protein
VLPGSTARREDRAAWNRVWGRAAAAGCFKVVGTLLATRARRISPVPTGKPSSATVSLPLPYRRPLTGPPVLYTHRGKPPAKRWIMLIELIDLKQQLSAFLQHYIFRKEKFFLICGTNRLEETSKSVIGSESE